MSTPTLSLHEPCHELPLPSFWAQVESVWHWALCALLGLALGAVLFSPPAQAARARPTSRVITETRAAGDPAPVESAAPNPAVQGRRYSSESANPLADEAACRGGRCGWVESVTVVEPSPLPPGVVVGIDASSAARPNPVNPLTPPAARHLSRPAASVVLAQSPVAAAHSEGAQLTRFHVRVRMQDGQLLTFEQLEPLALGVPVLRVQGRVVPLHPGAAPALAAGHPPPAVTGKRYGTE